MYSSDFEFYEASRCMFFVNSNKSDHVDDFRVYGVCFPSVAVPSSRVVKIKSRVAKREKKSIVIVALLGEYQLREIYAYDDNSNAGDNFSHMYTDIYACIYMYIRIMRAIEVGHFVYICMCICVLTCIYTHTYIHIYI